MNGSKCAAVHIKADGKNKKWYVAQNIHTKVNGRKIKTMKIGECFKHLGLWLNINKGEGSPEKMLGTLLNRVSSSVLKPQHKLEILRNNIVPKLLYQLGLNSETAAS